ncbi:sensor histidine kinase [Alicyclobacillus sp. ALC3]|uniref:sensor histidine kinase n=1 Tax=Alicyclobacillus sp. ALC3 TaxID=2796143 RepID=UPI002378D885|nr:HAMP domain-containing sensor histidine kinase [Alicyclobacillus sp. ALC3]WDL98020.1 HAMP domain-containing histidine kinase [Alicyclobacillus sp. ALC3]
MRIRRYMVVGVLSVICLPWLVYILVHAVDTHPWSTHAHRQTNVAATIQSIARSSSDWSDLAWQQQLNHKLSNEGVSVEIVSASNQVIFHSMRHGPPPWMPGSQQVMVVRNGTLVGTLHVSQPGPADPVAALAALLTAVSAILLVSIQIGRNVVRPLEAMSKAALQIADGDLDFQLQSSKTAEMRQVQQAFQVMGDGLRSAFAKQQKLEEERRFFIGAIAHDLRTPLFSLRGYLDGIEQGIAASPEKLAHYVAVCQDKAAHLERLVADLFAFTRLEYMEETLQREAFDLAALTRQAVSGVLTRAHAKHLSLVSNLPDEAVEVWGDPHLLERALTNLLDNALHHTPDGGTITVALHVDASKLTVTVRDTGPGFAANDMARVFDPMYRGDASRNLATGGAGLGLTIARRVFRAHGGDLSAENAPDTGALLTGWLPVEK